MTDSLWMKPARSHWTFLLGGSAGLALQQWLMVWLLARTAPVETVGRYGLAQAWVFPVCAIAGLQLRSLLASETRTEDLNRFYIHLRVLAIVLLLVAAAALAWVDPMGPGSGALLAAMVACRTIELGSDLADGFRHRAKRYHAIAISQAARAAAGLMGFAVVWLTTRALPAALLATCVAATASAVVLDLGLLRGVYAVRAKRAVDPRDRSEQEPNVARRPITPECAPTPGYREILVHALPLALVQFLNITIVYAPRAVLGAFGSLEAVASFTCLASILGATSLTAGAYSGSLAPDFAEASGEEPRLRLLGAGLTRIAIVVVPAGIVSTLAGEWILSAIFGNGLQFPIVAIGLTAVFAVLWSLATVFGTAATAARRTGLQLAAFAVSLVACVSAAWVLVPEFGLAGAAASLVASAAVLLAAYAVSEWHVPQSIQRESVLALPAPLRREPEYRSEYR